jgi:hypothetical protein
VPTENDILDVRAALDRQAMQDEQERQQAARRVPSTGVVGDFLAGAGSYILNRTPGVAPHMQGGPLPPDTAAATVGGIAPGAGVGMLLPGAGPLGMAAQGGLSAFLEYLRPGSTPATVAKEGAFGAAATGAFDLAGRAVGGMAQRIRALQAEGAKQIVRTQSETLRTVADTLGGLGQFNQQQQHIITKGWVRAIGEQADDLGPEVRREAAKRIGAVMDAALPSGPVDVTEAYTLLDEIPAEVFPGKRRLLAEVAQAENNPRAYQKAMAALREASRNMMQRDPGWGDEVVQSLNVLGEAGEAAGAANTRVVREQYKNLMILESIPTVRRTGQVPALSMEARVFSRYGPGVSRRAGEGLLPESAEAIAVTQAASSELAQKFRSSGTAERGAQAEVAQDALGLLTGQTNPSAFIRSAGTLFGVGPLAGLASQGNPAPLAGRLGAAVVRDDQ